MLKSLWRRALEMYERPPVRKVVRYAAVSVISTAVWFVTFTLVFGVYKVWSPVWSNIFANAVATVPSYYLNRAWAWGKTGRSHVMKEILPFWALSFGSLFVSIGVVWAASRWASHHHYAHFETTVVVEGANVATYGVLWVAKFTLNNLIFRHAPHVAALSGSGAADVEEACETADDPAPRAETGREGGELTEPARFADLGHVDVGTTGHGNGSTPVGSGSGSKWRGLANAVRGGYRRGKHARRHGHGEAGDALDAFFRERNPD